METDELNSTSEFLKKLDLGKQNFKKEVEQVLTKKVKQDPLKKLQIEYYNYSLDIISDLLNVSSKLSEEISKGRCGSNLNYELLQLFVRLSTYRKNMTKNVLVEGKEKLDIKNFQKELKKMISNLEKLRK